MRQRDKKDIRGKVRVWFLAFAIPALISGCFFLPAVVHAEEDEPDNPYGITVTLDATYHFYGEPEDSIEAVTAVVEAPEEWKDKIRYQWMVESRKADYEMVEIPDATSASYTPTAAILEDGSYFRCQITLEGDSSFSLQSSYAVYEKYNDMVDLSQGEYDDAIEMPPYSSYLRKIVGKEGTQALRIHWKPEEYMSNLLVIDADGNFFQCRTETTLEVKGRICYLSFYSMDLDSTPERIGIQSVEERSEFTRMPYVLDVYETSGDVPDYMVGDRLDVSGLSAELRYNDGSFEIVSVDSLVCDTLDQPLVYGTNCFRFTDKATGLFYDYVIEVTLRFAWKEKPAATFQDGEPQRASLEIPDNAGAIRFLWVLRNRNGEVVAEIEDDTEPEIVLPQGLSNGYYVLYCYFYDEESGFEESQYMVTEFRVKGSVAPSASPLPTGTPSATGAPDNPAPTASPEPGQQPGNQMKKPGQAKLTVGRIRSGKKKKAVTLRLKKISGADGYQIVYATNKKGTKGKVSASTKKLTYRIKGLKKNRKYYVRVRAFCKDKKGKKVYGKWSKCKTL